MENKKTKLTISGKPKKSFKDFETSKNQGKKTVVIDKHHQKSFGKSASNRPGGFKQSSTNFKKGSLVKNNFQNKTQPITSDFERRKLAEQRATKRLKGDLDTEKKAKLGPKKRELKLTVSRALSDQIETRERSLASVKRARQKELKNAKKDDDKENLKPIRKLKPPDYNNPYKID